MSVLDKILGLFSGGGSAHQAARRLYLLDAARLLDDRAGGGRIGPREQVQILQQLARFAEQEKVRIIAVFAGRPLREVEDGGEYNGITVHFAEAEGSIGEVILKLARKKAPVVIVTSDAQLEAEAVKQGASAIRASTFRKALSGGGNGGGDRGGERGGDRRGGGRDRRRHFRRGNGDRRGNGGGQEGGGASQSEQSEGGEASQQSAPASNDPVSKLIDLVE